MQAILLAAGFGTRLRPYSKIRPKPLFPVLNRPLIHHLLDMLIKAGCDEIVVNAHHLAQQIDAAVEGYPQVTVQMEQDIRGTGGSLRLALRSLERSNKKNRPVLVMNGDIVHNIDLSSLYDAHLRSANQVTMAMHDYPRLNSVVVDGKRVTSFCHGRHKGKEKLSFTGIHVVNQEIIRQIPEHVFFHIIDLYEKLTEKGEIGLERVDSSFWKDIGTPEDYLALHGELLNRNDDLFLSPSSLCMGNWVIGRGVKIGRGVRFLDWGCLGDGVRVGDGAVLRRSVVWDGVEIVVGKCVSDVIVT
jgi:mannose-1-phosphate guanylyltransferase